MMSGITGFWMIQHAKKWLASVLTTGIVRKQSKGGLLKTRSLRDRVEKVPILL